MNGPLPPRLLQLIGLAIILGSIIYSLATGHSFVEFLGTGTTLVAIGSVINAQNRKDSGDKYEVPPSQQHGELPPEISDPRHPPR